MISLMSFFYFKYIYKLDKSSFQDLKMQNSTTPTSSIRHSLFLNTSKITRFDDLIEKKYKMYLLRKNYHKHNNSQRL